MILVSACAYFIAFSGGWLALLAYQDAKEQGYSRTVQQIRFLMVSVAASTLFTFTMIISGGGKP